MKKSIGSAVLASVLILISFFLCPTSFAQNAGDRQIEVDFSNKSKGNAIFRMGVTEIPVATGRTVNKKGPEAPNITVAVKIGENVATTETSMPSGFAYLVEASDTGMVIKRKNLASNSVQTSAEVLFAGGGGAIAESEVSSMALSMPSGSFTLGSSIDAYSATGFDGIGLSGTAAMSTANVMKEKYGSFGLKITFAKLELDSNASPAEISFQRFDFNFRYGVAEKVEVAVNLPYSMENVKVGSFIDTDESGVGDLSLAAKYYAYSKDKIEIAGAFNLQLPTGDEDKIIVARGNPYVGFIGDLAYQVNEKAYIDGELSLYFGKSDSSDKNEQDFSLAVGGRYILESGRVFGAYRFWSSSEDRVGSSGTLTIGYHHGLQEDKLGVFGAIAFDLQTRDGVDSQYQVMLGGAYVFGGS
ncbi:MAG: transporter [Planctomycetes bacterium]|nr:transporter [Planctomycetota bacterium]